MRTYSFVKINILLEFQMIPKYKKNPTQNKIDKRKNSLKMVRHVRRLRNIVYIPFTYLVIINNELELNRIIKL